MTGQMSCGLGASAAYCVRNALYAWIAAWPPTSICPTTGQLVSVIAPVGAAEKVPTLPEMVPFVQVTLSFASTAKPGAVWANAGNAPATSAVASRHVGKYFL